MLFKNQTVVFQLGMKVNANLLKQPCYKIHIQDSNIIRSNRRKSLKATTAKRIRTISEDTTFDNCTIYLEGTLTADRVVPWGREAFIIQAGKIS
jgi:ribosome-interacting GTPase 1